VNFATPFATEKGDEEREDAIGERFGTNRRLRGRRLMESLHPVYEWPSVQVSPMRSRIEFEMPKEERAPTPKRP